MNSTFSLCLPEIFCLQSLVLSARMYVLPSRTSKPCQSEIFSPCLYEQGKANGVQAIRQNISLWQGLLVLEGQYIHTSRENKTLETEYFWQTEREGGVHIIRLCRRPCCGLPCYKIGLLLKTTLSQNILSNWI